MAQDEKKYFVSGMTPGLFEDINGEQGGVKVTGKRCRWCGWTAIGFHRTPDHECTGPRRPAAALEQSRHRVPERRM